MKKNCFDEIRLTLAIIVFFSHAQEISGAFMWPDVFDFNFAIKGFFAISGYLVTKSYFSSASVYEFFERRVRRIYPAYIAVIGYGFLIGLVITNLNASEFFTLSTTYKYLFFNLIFLNFLQPSIPGVFEGWSISAVNGSLWTIKIEIMLYLLIPLIVFLYRKIGIFAAFCLMFAGGVLWFTYFTHGFDHPMGSVLARQFPGQIPYFVMGSFLATKKIRPWVWNALLLMSSVYLALDVPPGISDYTNMAMYPLFVIGLSQISWLNVGVGRIGDLSYGVYLFHFPTLQLLKHFTLFELYPYGALIAAALITLFLAYASWVFVERRFLRRSSHYVHESVSSR